MNKKKTIRYWDSDCFIGWFNQEPDKVDMCKATIDRAEAGEVQLVVSALTLIEVIKMKNHPSLPRDKEEMIRKYFQNDFIKLVNVDRMVGELARSLIWGFNVQPKDSIHVATAILQKVPVLNTFDAGLIKLNQKVGGNPPLIICNPDFIIEPKLDFKDENKKV